LPFYAEDVVWYAFSEAPDYRGGFHGHDGIRELTGNWTDSFDEFAIVGQEFRDRGDRVVALGEISGKIKGSDVAIRQTGREYRVGLPQRQDR
jgi:ketosteroid isomerase-like protein